MTALSFVFAVHLIKMFLFPTCDLDWVTVINGIRLNEK